MAVNNKNILSYPISRIRETANNFSDTFLTGIWLTGVTLGLVKSSADNIKKFVIRPKKKPKSRTVTKSDKEVRPKEKTKPQTAAKPEKDDTIFNLSEDAKSIDEELSKLEQSVTEIEKELSDKESGSISKTAIVPDNKGYEHEKRIQ